MHRFLVPLLAITLSAAAQRLADLPDPLIGTDSKYELSHGNTYPAIFIPYAMAAWTPQTGEGGWQYQYAKDSIRGFRMTHRPSAWTIDWGSFSIMPGTGALKVLPDARGSKFRHSNETSRAYRYDVLLDDYQTRVAMAPSAHGGILRFTFPKTDQSWVVLDASSGGSSVQIHPESNRITGTSSKTAKGTAPGFALYFVAEFDRPFTSFGTWNGKGEKDGAKTRSGDHTGAFAGFNTADGKAVTVRVGTSLISLEQAERSLKAELPKPDLDAAAEAARQVWERDLGTIEIQGGTETQRRTFYTALYHSLQFPRMLNETDASGAMVHYGLYDGKVHAGPMFTDIGFWDVFRAQFPLLTIINPALDAEIIRAMVNTYEEAGWIPTWPNPVETNVMIGTHADSAVADAYVKGIRGRRQGLRRHPQGCDATRHGDLRRAPWIGGLSTPRLCSRRRRRRRIGSAHPRVCLRRFLRGADGPGSRQTGRLRAVHAAVEVVSQPVRSKHGLHAGPRSGWLVADAVRSARLGRSIHGRQRVAMAVVGAAGYSRAHEADGRP